MGWERGHSRFGGGGLPRFSRPLYQSLQVHRQQQLKKRGSSSQEADKRKDPMPTISRDGYWSSEAKVEAGLNGLNELKKKQHLKLNFVSDSWY